MTNDRKIVLLGWAIGAFLIVLSRLPMVIGASAALDGDEAILALMSMHLSEGKPLELFFYGQNFGVTIVENINAALFFLLLGSSTTSLKIATLVLWIGGWSFFLFGTYRLTNTSTALLASTLLLACSAWGLWSTLARGYHVGGFMLCQFCYWQFSGLYKANKLFDIKLARFALMGASVALLFFTQKLWFISFLPFLAILLWQRKNQREMLTLIMTAAMLALLVQLLSKNTSQYWNPEYLQNMNPLAALVLTPERIWTFFSGAYSYSIRMDSNLFAKITASAWCLMLIFSSFILAKSLHNLTERPLYGAIIASGLLLVGATLFISNPLFGYRYLLPLAGPSSLTIALCLVNQPNNWHDLKITRSTIATTVITAILVGSGLLTIFIGNEPRASITFGPTKLSRQESLDYLIRDLKSNDIHHVYSLDPMLQWNIIFSSQEDVIARWSDPIDRRPEYPLQVDRALFAGESIAIVGTAESLESFTAFLQSKNIGPLPINTAGDHYFWSPNPDKYLLQTIGFELNEVSVTEEY